MAHEYTGLDKTTYNSPNNFVIFTLKKLVPRDGQFFTEALESSLCLIHPKSVSCRDANSWLKPRLTTATRGIGRLWFKQVGTETASGSCYVFCEQLMAKDK